MQLQSDHKTGNYRIPNANVTQLPRPSQQILSRHEWKYEKQPRVQQIKTWLSRPQTEQLDIVETLVKRRDVFAVLPTSYGKSLAICSDAVHCTASFNKSTAQVTTTADAIYACRQALHLAPNELVSVYYSAIILFIVCNRVTFQRYRRHSSCLGLR